MFHLAKSFVSVLANLSEPGKKSSQLLSGVSATLAICLCLLARQRNRKTSFWLCKHNRYKLTENRPRSQSNLARTRNPASLTSSLTTHNAIGQQTHVTGTLLVYSFISVRDGCQEPINTLNVRKAGKFELLVSSACFNIYVHTLIVITCSQLVYNENTARASLKVASMASLTC